MQFLLKALFQQYNALANHNYDIKSLNCVVKKKSSHTNYDKELIMGQKSKFAQVKVMTKIPNIFESKMTKRVTILK